MCACVVVTQSCQTLCNPIDCNPLGSSIHGILQTRILEWGFSILFSRVSYQPRDRSPGLLNCRQILYHLSYQGSP